jgi:hypothetical protein
MNEKSKHNFPSMGPKRWATSHGIGGGGMSSNMSRVMGGMSGMSNRRNDTSGMGGYDMTQDDEQPATAPNKDNVQRRINKSIAADPYSFSLETTTIPQQAAQESNFIGSAYFYNLSINQVWMPRLLWIHF